MDLILCKDKYGIGFRTGSDENATRMLLTGATSVDKEQDSSAAVVEMNLSPGIRPILSAGKKRKSMHLWDAPIHNWDMAQALAFFYGLEGLPFYRLNSGPALVQG